LSAVIRIQVLPHKRLCPQGAEFEARAGQRLARVLEANEVPIETACENACACGTCHVIIRSGFATLAPAAEREEDTLDKAWGVTAQSRLACQVVLGDADLVIELPKYSVNLVREG
jgi:2Fe-2S ferredoxin